MSLMGGCLGVKDPKSTVCGVWEGEVHVFDLMGHTKAKLVFAGGEAPPWHSTAEGRGHEPATGKLRCSHGGRPTTEPMAPSRRAKSRCNCRNSVESGY